MSKYSTKMVRIEERYHQRLKKQALEEEKTVQEVVNQLIEDYLSQESLQAFKEKLYDKRRTIKGVQ